MWRRAGDGSRRMWRRSDREPSRFAAATTARGVRIHSRLPVLWNVLRAEDGSRSASSMVEPGELLLLRQIKQAQDSHVHREQVHADEAPQSPGAKVGEELGHGMGRQLPRKDGVD